MMIHFSGLVQDGINSSTLPMELLQLCTQPLACSSKYPWPLVMMYKFVEWIT